MDFLHATATAMQKIVYSASLTHSFIRTMRFGISMKRNDNCTGNMKERVETNPDKTSFHTISRLRKSLSPITARRVTSQKLNTRQPSCNSIRKNLFYIRHSWREIGFVQGVVSILS